jgi:hypothetical protein
MENIWSVTAVVRTHVPENRGAREMAFMLMTVAASSRIEIPVANPHFSSFVRMEMFRILDLFKFKNFLSHDHRRQKDRIQNARVCFGE